MVKCSDLSIWAELQEQAHRVKHVSLDSLFEQDPDRATRWTIKLNGLESDFSRNHISDETLALLLRLAKERDVEGLRDQMVSGTKINNTENRAVLHTALRTAKDDPVYVDGQDVMPAIRSLHQKLAKFVADVREERWLGATGQPIRNVVNIGIGGSDLGPRLVVSALREQATGPQVHFVANVDAADLMGLLPKLDPATTLFVIVSKTFTTQETLLNARSAREWLVGALGEEAVAQHFVSVSTNRDAVESFGIHAENMFAMWDWVGGRYSLWSAVGVGIALSVGFAGFQKLLAGAALMDEHFCTAPLDRNIPVLAALIGVWYRNFWGTSALAILPYSERLRDMPRYLQQLDMESNGKSVTRDGEPIDYQTGPIVFGECGSVGQHSFHQWLHQGSSFVPADFIGVRQDDMHRPEHHAVLLAHMQAQVEALMSGRQDPDPARTNPGNKPTSVYWLETLDPYTLGVLLALYEHKVFVQGVIWGINSFDQFGVELGKKLANERLKREKASTPS
ncbi:MAG: glucose-6-phosphate isomerase [Alphaproteobacteria bacterium]|nr:glucose-6-phosphate isomerase [Alphaproteobacteria bacterium]